MNCGSKFVVIVTLPFNQVLACIKLNEDDTTSSRYVHSRRFDEPG